MPYIVPLYPSPMRASGSRIAFFGDSILGSSTAVWTPVTGANFNIQGRGMPTFGPFLNNQRTRWSNACYSTAGLTSTTAIPQLAAQVLPFRPHACVLMVGQNNAQQVTSLDPFRADLLTMIGMLRDNNILPILCTLQANSTANATLNQMLRLMSQYVKQLADANGFPVLDWLSKTADPTSATGIMLAAYNSGDNVHLNDVGQFAVAGLMNDAGFLSYFPNGTPYLTTDTADANNMLVNGTFQGAGPVATSWAVTNAGAGYTDSTVADANILGQWQQTTAAAATPQHHIGQTVAAGPLWAVGDTIAFSGLFMGSGNVAGGMKASCWVNGFGAGKICEPMTLWQVDSASPGGTFYGTGVIASGTTQLDVRLATETGAAGTIRWGRVTLTNLSRSSRLMDINSIAQA